MTQAPDEHRLELLRVFKNAPSDLDANRLGQLGPGQLGADHGHGVAVLIVIILLVGTRPIAPWRWGLIAVVALAGLALGVQCSRELRRALRERTVEGLTGPVRVRMQGRSGWWLTVAGQSFHLPVRFWHVGPDLPQVAPLDPAAIHAWAQALSVAPARDAPGALLALRFGGPIVKDDFGRLQLQPPPGQTEWARVDERDGKLHGLQFKPGPVPVTRAALDAEFGPGREYPRVHWDSSFTLTYFVTVENAPFACDVIACFRDQPGPATAAYEISLRRHTPWTAPAPGTTP
jgi:hypothetical protein